eukprot:8967129-Pyramimonas_sp.AAC.2
MQYTVLVYAERLLVCGLQRSKRVVQETIQVGTETAVKLQGQTQQMEKIVDDLDQIHFSLKKAKRLVRDIARGLATDKCIMAFLGLIAIGVLTIFLLKTFKPGGGGGGGSPQPGQELVQANDNRRLLMSVENAYDAVDMRVHAFQRVIIYGSLWRPSRNLR